MREDEPDALDRLIGDALRADARRAPTLDAPRVWARIDAHAAVRTTPRLRLLGVSTRAFALVAAGVLVVVMGERVARRDWQSSGRTLDQRLEEVSPLLPPRTIAAVRASLGALDSGIVRIEASLADAGADRPMLEARIEDYHRRRHDLLSYVLQQAEADGSPEE